MHDDHQLCHQFCSVIWEYINIVGWSNLFFQHKCCFTKRSNIVLRIDPAAITHTIELELGVTILVSYVLVKFYIYESI